MRQRPSPSAVPSAGSSPIFRPVKKVRSLYDWFTPPPRRLPPLRLRLRRREDGYFLLSVWVLNYGVVSMIGLLAGIYIQSHYNPGVWSPMWLWLLPLPVISFLLARHSKAIFLAIDHAIDPHVKPPAKTEEHPRPR